ncbi:hypothetical protein [Streptomyces sp. NPDC005374]|uniref:hypothetical protein n=1 Tax=Streptomyces sp. NPDC005374 TaxID=3364713 RepID=UPI0036A25F6B
MRFCKSVVTLVFVAALSSGAVGSATAAPMPWETSKVPTVTTGHNNVNIVLCGNPCYQ